MKELILGYVNKHSVLRASKGKKILIREADLCVTFLDKDILENLEFS